MYIYNLLSTTGVSERHGSVPSLNAASSTSRTFCTNTNCIHVRTFFGTSSPTPFRFDHGAITVLAPARRASSTFALTAPTGEIRPRSVIYTERVQSEDLVSEG